MKATLWQYAFLEVARRKGRSAGVVVGAALGIGLFVAIVTLADGYHRLIQQPFKALQMDVTIQRSSRMPAAAPGSGLRLPPANQPISAANTQAIRALPQWEAVTGALVLWHQSAKGFMVICGVDAADAGGFDAVGPAKVNEWVVQGRPLNRNRSPRDGQVLLEKHYARVNRLKLGQTIPIGGRSFNIAGLVELKPENAISKADAYLTLEQARDLAGLPEGSVNMLFGRLKKGVEPESLRHRMTSIMPDGKVTGTDNIGQMMKGFDRLSGGFSRILSGLALLFAAFICYRLQAGSIQERRREIGVMKAVGWQNRDIARVFTLEALYLGLAGGLAGIAAGYGISWVLGGMKIGLKLPWNLNPAPAAAGESIPLLVSLPVAFSWQTALLALAVSALIGMATGALASRKPAALKPMAAFREI